MLYSMKEKGEASDILQNFVAFVKNQFEKNMKIIHSANGYKFTSGPIKRSLFREKKYFTKIVVDRFEST